MSKSFVSLRRSWRLAGVAALLAVAACASPPTVRTNVNLGTDFTQYKTFGFVDPLGTGRAGYRSIVSQHLIADTEREMQARGLTRSDSAPELLVSFNAKLADALQVVPGPLAPVMVGVGGYYGHRAGMDSTWPMYSQDTVIQYTQGTLNIDVVDADHKQLVWGSVVTDSVTQKDRDNLPVAVNNAVVAAFARFPIPVVTQ
jgi:Domain of unknown function (DUF4136)